MSPTVEPVAARHVGASVSRAEDPRLLTGRGRYVDDITLPGMLHAAFRRSQVPHARLVSLDVSEARELRGVVAIYTGAELKAKVKPEVPGSVIGINQMPGIKLPEVWPLAVDKVRFVGDPIALVVAEDRYIAEDACDLIVEEYETLDPIATFEHALDPARSPIFDEFGDNIAFRGEMALGDVDGAFARADHVVQTTLSVHRHQNVPMEGRGSIASWDRSDQQLVFHTSTQSPHLVRTLLSPQIGVPTEKIRVLTADVGGSFGLKGSVFREDVALAAASMDVGRPVKWIEDRAENLAVSGQAREEKADIEAAVAEDGRILAVRMDAFLDQGAYPGDPFPGSIFVGSLSGSFQGPSRLEAIAATHTSVFSNKASYVAYRGPWATADWLRERLLDIVARQLGRDPVDVRRVNYVVRDQPPLTMLTGQLFAGVTARESLEQAATVVGWERFRERQRQARSEGKYLGAGIASYIEAAPGPRQPNRGAGFMSNEVSHVSFEKDGRVVVVTQQQPHGQGHETTLAQIAADELGVAFEDVSVRYGDTDFTPPALVATGGSRSATMAGGAVLHGSRTLRAKLLAVASQLWEANPDDLEVANGTVSVKGTPQVAMPIGEIIRIVEEEPERLPQGIDTDLKVTASYDGGEGGWSGGTHCCFVEVDAETGRVRIDRYVVVEDCGIPINPSIVEGQIRGGVVQGIGAVLLERSAYGEDGQFLAGTFMDYLLPTTTEVPNLEIHHLDTIALDPDVNFRGVGEGGMIVAPAAVTNAIEDALAPFNAEIREEHLPPNRILELIGAVPTESDGRLP